MEQKKWIYIGVFLDEMSTKVLLNRFGNKIPNSWRMYNKNFHMTIAFNDGSEASYAKLREYQPRFGEKVNLIVTDYGKSPDAIAVKVVCNGVKSLNKIPHITLATPKNGRPVNSNYITDWTPLGPPQELIPISGTIDIFSK